MKFEIDMPDITFNEKFAEEDLVKVMGQELTTQNTIIKANLMKGVGADGERLRPYSDSYNRAKWAHKNKTKLDKNTPNPPPLTPDLHVTGELHKSMDVKSPKTIRDVGEIQFKGGHKGEIQNAALAAILQARGFTGWFQFGQSGLDRIQKAIMAAIDKNLKKAVDVKSKGAPQ